jgi:hypothetical protein
MEMTTGFVWWLCLPGTREAARANVTGSSGDTARRSNAFDIYPAAVKFLMPKEQ